MADHDADWRGATSSSGLGRQSAPNLAKAGSPIGGPTGDRVEAKCAAIMSSTRPLGIVVLQTLNAPGIEGELTQRLFLPNYADWIECESWWDMGLSSHPDATYLIFPFDVPGATALRRGRAACHPARGSVPGSCRDYFTVQGWSTSRTKKRGT
ncbi:MAG: hypothetical protein R2856_00250 [Caldilineaceae bacterium]